MPRRAIRIILQSEFVAAARANPRTHASIAVRSHFPSTLSRFFAAWRGRRAAIRRIGAALRIDVEAHCSAENDRALLARLPHPSFSANSRWMATMLGIPIDDVNLSLQRLIRERRLVMASRDEWQEAVNG